MRHATARDEVYSLSLLVGSLLLIAPTPEAAAKRAVKELQGEWHAVSIEEKGEKWSEKEAHAIAIEINGDTLTYRRERTPERFRITLDPTKRPAWMDLRLIAEDANPALACHAIYALDGNRLKLCLATEFRADDAAKRPKKFMTGGSRPPLGRLLLVLERAKKR